MNTITPARVRLNNNVAPAFVGQPGTIIGTRNSSDNGHLFIVRLDTPTAPAPGWSPLETLGVGRHCFSTI